MHNCTHTAHEDNPECRLLQVMLFVLNKEGRWEKKGRKVIELEDKCRKSWESKCENGEEMEKEKKNGEKRLIWELCTPSGG